jgi:hypothetical protein
LSDQEDKVGWKEDYNLLKKPNCGNFWNGKSFCPQQNAMESCGGAFAENLIYNWGWLEWRSHGLPTLVVYIIFERLCSGNFFTMARA